MIFEMVCTFYPDFDKLFVSYTKQYLDKLIPKHFKFQIGGQFSL